MGMDKNTLIILLLPLNNAKQNMWGGTSYLQSRILAISAAVDLAQRELQVG